MANQRGGQQRDNTAQFCVKCGYKLQPGDVFCMSCGRQVATESSASGRNFHHAPAQNVPQRPPVVNTNQVLYQSGSIGYYPSGLLVQVYGAIEITPAKVSYTTYSFPMNGLPWSKRTVEFPMQSITRTERATVMGINACLRFYTRDGKKYLFAFGVTKKADMESVMAIVQQYGS